METEIKECTIFSAKVGDTVYQRTMGNETSVVD